jgi:hypothetical protein
VRRVRARRVRARVGSAMGEILSALIPYLHLPLSPCLILCIPPTSLSIATRVRLTL